MGQAPRVHSDANRHKLEGQNDATQPALASLVAGVTGATGLSMTKHGKFAQISTLKSMPGYHLWSQDLHVVDCLAMFQENPWLSKLSVNSWISLFCGLQGTGRMRWLRKLDQGISSHSNGM